MAKRKLFSCTIITDGPREIYFEGRISGMISAITDPHDGGVEYVHCYWADDDKSYCAIPFQATDRQLRMVIKKIRRHYYSMRGFVDIVFHYEREVS